jgi:hypothetical protein
MPSTNTGPFPERHPIKRTFDRAQLIEVGEQVKTDIFHALYNSKPVSLLPEAYGEFLLTAITCYGLTVRAQLLDNVSKGLAAGTLDEAKIDSTIEYLAKELDREAARLGEQYSLIMEVRSAPKAKN